MTTDNDIRTHYKSLDDISLRKAKLLDDIRKDQKKMGAMWNEMFRPGQKSRKKGMSLQSIMSTGMGVLDGALFETLQEVQEVTPKLQIVQELPHTTTASTRYTSKSCTPPYRDYGMHSFFNTPFLYGFSCRAAPCCGQSSFCPCRILLS